MDVLNVTSNERVDLADFTYGTSSSQLGFTRESNSNFMNNPTGTQQMWVLNGFTMSNPSAKLLQVNLGVAMLGYRVGAIVSYGVITCNGAASQNVDLTSFPTGTYGIYIRFNYIPGTIQSRIFWNPANAGSEFAQSTPTRLTATWELRVEAASPGSEWLQIGTVAAPGMTIVDMRPMYFEGRVDQTYANTWGTGTDRNADREQYGVHDFQNFTAAMRTCLEDIKGPGLVRWWNSYVAGQTIGYAGTAVASQTSWADSGFYLQGSTTAPTMGWGGTSNGTQKYTRSTNQWAWLLSSTNIATLDATALTVKGNLWIGSLGTSIAGEILHVDGGSLSSTSGTNKYLSSMQLTSANADALNIFYVRSATGSTSTTADLYIQRKVDTTAGESIVFFGGGGFGIGQAATPYFMYYNGFSSVLFNSAPANIVFDGSTPVQLNAAASSGQYYGVSKAGSTGIQIGFANNSTVGSFTVTGGLIRVATTDPLVFNVNNSVRAGLITSTAGWGFGTALAQGSLLAQMHVQNVSGGPTNTAYFEHTTADCLFRLNATATQQAVFDFSSVNTVLYRHGKGNDNTYFARDIVNGINFIQWAPSALTLGPGVSITPANTGTGVTMANVTGDINAQGGFRQQIGPACIYYTPGGGGVAQTTVTQSLQMPLVVMTTGLIQASSSVENLSFIWVAPYSGSIVGVSAYLYTTVNTTLTISAVNNNTGNKVSVTLVANAVSGSAVAAKDAIPFSVGHTISITYAFGTNISASPNIIAFATVES